MNRQMQQAINRAQGKRWQWPGDGVLLPRNCRQTNKPEVTASSETLFTSTGPSKRTKNKRMAKALRGRGSKRVAAVCRVQLT